jgi:hypothetical protein
MILKGLFLGWQLGVSSTGKSYYKPDLLVVVADVKEKRSGRRTRFRHTIRCSGNTRSITIDLI